MSSISSAQSPAHRPLKILIFQPEGVYLEKLVGELRLAGFEVNVDLVTNSEAFEEHLRQGSYDLAINGLPFATHEGKDAPSEPGPFAIMCFDLEGNLALWNRSAEHIFGWAEQEVLGKNLPTLPLGEDAEYDQILTGQFRGTSHAGVRVRRQRKDGSFVEVSLHTMPLRDVHGATTGNLAILAELPDAHAAMQQNVELSPRGGESRTYAEAERRFRQLLEAAPDGIVEMDSDGRIVLVNAVMEKLTGFSRSELLGQSLEIIVPSELRARHVHHRANFWTTPMTRPMGSGMQLNLQRKDGGRVPVEISLSPVQYDGAVRVTAIVRDITERKRAEQQIREMQERLTAELTLKNQELELRNLEIERANRLKTEFVASMSHELRTPLHTIIGFAQLIAEELEGPLTPKQKRFIDHIHKDSLHLLELINDVLDISRIEAGRLELRLETFDMMTAIDEVLSSIRPQAAAKSIHLEASSKLGVSLHADRVRFKEVLYNLLSNAVKFTAEDGLIRLDASAKDGFAEIIVADTGVGIPTAEQEAIFDKFYQVGSTTRGVREGTGLGLAIVKQLIEAHRGRIWLHSSPGHGSRFHFTMPLEVLS